MTYDDDSNEVVLVTKFGVARIMMLQHNYYCCDQVSNDAACQMSKLCYDCNADTGVMTLGTKTAIMLLKEFNINDLRKNYDTTLSFCLSANMISKKVGIMDQYFLLILLHPLNLI